MKISTLITLIAVMLFAVTVFFDISLLMNLQSEIQENINDIHRIPDLFFEYGIFLVLASSSAALLINVALQRLVALPLEQLQGNAHRYLKNAVYLPDAFVATIEELKTLHKLNNRIYKDLNGLEEEFEQSVKERTEALKYSEDLEDLVAKRTEELQASQEELKKYSDDLEVLVAKRTEELQASQEELANINENLEQLVEQRTKELQDSQTQLIQSEKMSSLGQMVAGLAHEINTPLAFVQNNVFELKSAQQELTDIAERFVKTHHNLINNDSGLETLLLENHSLLETVDLDFFKEGSQLFNDSYEGLEQIKDLIINLKNFSRLDEADMKDTDIKASLDSTLKIAHNFLKHRVTVVKEYGDIPIVKCYPSRLNQVFLNLITNAAQACEKQSGSEQKGQITLRTAYIDRKVVIDIADSGTGIPPENLKKIFEPFFTTKPVGSGTGLGLSIVYKIIEQHNGIITVDSKVGSGTTFKIHLPVTVAKQERVSMFADEETKDMNS